VITPSRDGYVASVRSPAGAAASALDFCRRFPTGGGRKGAAGVNCLPASELEDFLALFTAEPWTAQAGGVEHV
ncbi:MAG: hypothetical protein ACM3X5_05770, partial [Bacillota bacterium]